MRPGEAIEKPVRGINIIVSTDSVYGLRIPWKDAREIIRHTQPFAMAGFDIIFEQWKR